MPSDDEIASRNSFLKLLHKAQEGSRLALGALLADSQRYLGPLAQCQLSPACDWSERPSDAVQDTLLAAIRSFLEFRGQTEEEFRGWLRRILINTICAYQRARDAKPAALEDPASPRWRLARCASRELGPAQMLERQEQDEKFRRCFHSLPANCQTILQLHQFQHLSFEEIAVRLDISSDAARKRCTRALLALGKVARQDGLLQAARPGGA